MKTFAQHQPLPVAELDRLAEFLKSCKSGKGMNVEQLDGFFAALIAGPENVMPSEYTARASEARWRMPARLAASTKPMKF